MVEALYLVHYHTIFLKKFCFHPSNLLRYKWRVNNSYCTAKQYFNSHYLEEFPSEGKSLLLSNSDSVNFRHSRRGNIYTCKYRFAALELRGDASCFHFVVLQTLAYLPPASSFMKMSSITLERYLSVLHPVFHRSYVTKSWMLICVICAVVWCIVTSPVVLKIISAKLHDILNTAAVLIVLAFNTFPSENILCI